MRHEVTESDTAVELGSGDVPVLATPRLIAWLEAATLRRAAPYTDAGQTTVGTAVRVEHRQPTPVGDSVDIVAEAPDDISGRRLTFTVRATDASGKIVATGEIDRALVQRDRFLAALTRTSNDD
ncbi:thioesterase family protein [Streptomyces oceani]|uniref:Thioesterase n=1 Tax=Streptomyces oceani TaxID=1075402 RepID=A0A1E7KK64_9ACTN|nr:thioesterase [Streptomyces oceani]OEV04247.1 thioesterase [Streptomyces oceani]